MKEFRILSFLLCVAMILTFAVSCGSNEEASKEESKTESQAESREESSSVEESSYVDDPLSHIEDQNLDRTIVFLVENQDGGGYGSKEIMPDGESEISPYVLDRNRMVEDKLGITISEIRTDSMTNDLRNAALTTPEFDIACPYVTTAAPLITEGLFYDLYEFDDILNLDAAYWDQNANSDLTMGGKLYMTTGDFSLLTMDVTHCMIFNKELIEKNSLESPYTLVKEKKWTMDKMLEMAKAVTADTDGVEGISYTDTIGLFINSNYSTSLFIGAGESLAKQNSQGVPELGVTTESAVTVAQKIYDIFHDDAVLYMEGFNDKAIADGFNNCYWASRDRLANNGALFCTISLSDVLNLAQYDCDFGMIVTPKLTEEQDRYYSYISVIFATCCVIPVGCGDPETAALVLEALNAASTNTVKLNYYERVFKLQKVKTDEDSDMLDFIFDNRVYDIGSIYNWGGLRDFVSGVCTANSFSYTNALQSKQGSMESQMQDTIDFFNE